MDRMYSAWRGHPLGQQLRWQRRRSTTALSALGGLVLLLLGTLAFGNGVAGAQDGENSRPVKGLVVETTTEKKTFIEGATVEVSQDGEVVASGTTNDKGRFEIDVNGTGKFEVKLVESSLPKGKKIPSTTKNPITFDTADGRSTYTANFQVGAGQSNDSTFSVSSLLNNTLIGIKFGLLIGLCAIGLSLIFGTTGLTNFAHGELVTFGAAIALILNNSVGLPLLIAAPLAVVAGGLAGWTSEVVVWRTLREGQASLAAKVILTVLVGPLGLFLVFKILTSEGAVLDKVIMTLLLLATFGAALVGIWTIKRNLSTSLVGQLVVSIGLSIFFRYTLYLMVGGRTQFYKDFANQREIKFGPFGLTPNDIFTIILALVVLGGVGLMLQKTRMGKAIRAVADNRALASSSGIDVQRVILSVWVMGGSMAALGGICLTLGNAGLKFDTGSFLLLLMFAGVTLGGLGTAYGALLGSVLIGVLVQVSPMFFASDLKEVGALVVLVLILLVRPQGLLGKSQRIG